MWWRIETSYLDTSTMVNLVEDFLTETFYLTLLVILRSLFFKENFQAPQEFFYCLFTFLAMFVSDLTVFNVILTLWIACVVLLREDISFFSNLRSFLLKVDNYQQMKTSFKT